MFACPQDGIQSHRDRRRAPAESRAARLRVSGSTRSPVHAAGFHHEVIAITCWHRRDLRGRASAIAERALAGARGDPPGRGRSRRAAKSNTALTAVMAQRRGQTQPCGSAQLHDDRRVAWPRHGPRCAGQREGCLGINVQLHALARQVGGDPSDTTCSTPDCGASLGVSPKTGLSDVVYSSPDRDSDLPAVHRRDAVDGCHV